MLILFCDGSFFIVLRLRLAPGGWYRFVEIDFHFRLFTKIYIFQPLIAEKERKRERMVTDRPVLINISFY